MDKLQFSTHSKATNTLLTVKKKMQMLISLQVGEIPKRYRKSLLPSADTSQVTAEDPICDGRGGGALAQNQTSVLLCPSLPDRRSEAGSWKKLPAA